MVRRSSCSPNACWILARKKPWITAEIFDLCDKRRELRKKRFEPEGAAKYKEMNNNIKRCMKKAKENWIGEHCCEIEENLRKNNSNRACHLVEDLTTVKQGKAATIKDRSEKMPHRRMRDNEPTERSLLSAVQSKV